MRNLTLGLVIAAFAFVAGVIIVWTTGVLDISTPMTSDVPSPLAEPAAPSPDQQNRLMIRFIGFEIHKDWAARFELVNYTARPVTYIGFRSKQETDFCTIAAQRDEKHEVTGAYVHAFGFKMRDRCLYSKAVILQTLEPNESVKFTVDKYEVGQLVKLDEKHKHAQIGFEFFTGEDKRREVNWSDYITFPDDFAAPQSIP